MHKRPVGLPQVFPTKDPNKDVLLIDTEGIDALDANDTHDVRIFTLALLLSNSFLYNSVGAIDETAMQTLSLMTRVTDSVRVSSKHDANMAELAQRSKVLLDPARLCAPSRRSLGTTIAASTWKRRSSV